mmetsp:Transcript_8987/g.20960  ORF Transcript_8987/g.20960 Transcript_8987/m.20960 type:complete len:420 (-) Transcript_8987:81-1340(-)
MFGVASALGVASYMSSGRAAVGGASTRARAPAMKWDVDIAPWELDYGLQRSPVRLPDGVEIGDPPQPFEVTDEQRRALYEDGAIVIPGVLNKEWIEYLRDATDWQVEHPHFWSIAGVASGLYDYIQRSVWASNGAFADFMYYSPVASALAGSVGAKELRLATDLLMVNPNKGFKWHQDNQNGPIDSFGEPGANEWTSLRWWVTMDDCPPDHGAPVYLRKSHLNMGVSTEAVFVDLEKDGLLAYPELLEFRPKAGDLIVWHARAIHKIDGPRSQDWESSRRRVLGGTVAIDDAKYLAGGRLLFADMGSHGMQDGDSLSHPLFPKLWPCSDPNERAEASAGRCTRTWEGVSRVWGGAFKSMAEMASFANVVNIGARKEGGGKERRELPSSLKLPSPPFPHDLPEIPLPFASKVREEDASKK